MPVDIENGGAIVFGVDDMIVPKFVVKGASHGVPWLSSILRSL
jgi:hypothetical protein